MKSGKQLAIGRRRDGRRHFAKRVHETERRDGRRCAGPGRVLGSDKQRSSCDSRDWGDCGDRGAPKGRNGWWWYSDERDEHDIAQP